MSKTVISIAVGVLLVVAGVGLWWAGLLDGLASALNLDILKEEQMVEENTTEPAPQAPPSELSTGSNSSDQALEQDTAQLDAELESYGEISSELDQSFEEEPVIEE